MWLFGCKHLIRIQKFTAHLHITAAVCPDFSGHVKRDFVKGELWYNIHPSLLNKHEVYQ